MGGVYFVSIFVYLHLKFYYCFIMDVTVLKEFFLLMFFMLILTTVIFYLRIIKIFTMLYKLCIFMQFIC